MAPDLRLANRGTSNLAGHARSLLEAIEEPSLIIEGTVVQMANARAQQLLGTNVEGRDVRLAIRHPHALELLLAHRSGSVDATGVLDQGRTWRMTVRPLWPQAALLRMIDRTDAVSAEKMRVDFVANASHELRTPLATVLGYAETLADEGDLAPELRVSFGGTIRQEARRMLRIIEDLMSLSRIEADRFVVPDESVDIADVIDLAVSHSAHLLARRACEVRLDIPDGLPAIRGDHSQLVQVFDNLIGNALRYGCDKVGMSIDVAANSTGPWVVATVTDHGAGMAREHLPRVTERFYRVDPARSRESGGTGLGLAIVKHIIERHRGTMDIQSTVGTGTCVTVRLPVGNCTERRDDR